MENKKAVPDFWAKEDWQAIWIGAIVIIIASSCAGKPNFFNGLKRDSKASVSIRGDVVNISNEDTPISKISRRLIKKPFSRPS